MDNTDNPAGPEQSIESRLAAVFAPEAAPAPETATETADVEPASTEETDIVEEGEEQPAETTVDWEDDDGTVTRHEVIAAWTRPDPEEAS